MPRKKKQEQIDPPKVGDHITSLPETDWVIARVWDQKDRWDLEVFRTKDGERGCCYVSKTNPVVRIKHSPRAIEIITEGFAFVVFVMSIKMLFISNSDKLMNSISLLAIIWSLRYIIKRVSKEF